MTTYRTEVASELGRWKLAIVREGTEIFSQGRMEPNGPVLPPTGRRSELVAVVVNGDQELAERICELLTEYGLGPSRETDEDAQPVRAEPVHLPWSYWDGVVETELRVDEYPYGGGIAGSGVQITLGQRRDGQIIAVRLPQESARRLALAILGGPSLDEEEPS